jgi:hypothetical protein
MRATELEDDQSYDGETVIETSNTLNVFQLQDDDRRLISEVIAYPNKFEASENVYGELHGWFPFKRGVLGALSELSLHVDGGSDNDKNEQGLNAKLTFDVVVDRERE